MIERPARAEDAAAIAALIRTLSTPSLVSPDGAGAEPYFESVGEAAERGYIESARYDYRVIVDADGTLAALGAVRDGTHLFHLFVEPSHQRRGLSRRLWDALRSAAFERAGGPFPFTVNATLPARPVYEHFGFVAVGDVKEGHGIRFQPMRREADLAGSWLRQSPASDPSGGSDRRERGGRQ